MKTPYFITLVIYIFLCFSCQNEESLIGEDFLTDDQHGIFIFPDKIDISSFSEKEDSVDAQGQKSLLGSYSHSAFGQTDASFYFQIMLANNEMNFNANSITNIKLNLPYSDFHGDSLAEFIINISQLNENISDADTEDYFSNQNFATTFITNTSPITLLQVQDSSALQLDLPITFGLNEILNLSKDQLNNNESFSDAFNGFKIDVNPISSSSGAIMYLDTSSDDAFLHIEYIDMDGNSQLIDFPIGSGIKLNHFSHDYTNTTTNIEEIDNRIFVQSMGGVFSELDLSFLESLWDSAYIVNSALLSFSIFEDDESFSYPYPNQLSLVEYDNDQLLSIEGLMGGILNTEENKYEFDITRHVQKILTHHHNTVCRLYTFSRTSNADRVILSNTSTNPIRLQLILIDGEY